MSFDLSNHSLNIWESIGTLIPKVGVHLGVLGSLLHTLGGLTVILRLHS
jgi:hypothetical protein